jgi:hypothetical protein
LVPGFDSLQLGPGAGMFFQNDLGGLCPDERFGVGVVSGEIVLDSSNQLSHAGKGAAPDFLAGDLGEKALD